MFKSIGGFFKSVFTDILPPVILGIAGGPVAGPLMAAAYSGIKTGIETGSPLAGLGSAAMSFAGSKIGYGLDAKGVPTTGPLGGTSPIDATKGTASFIQHSGKAAQQAASGSLTGSGLAPTFMLGGDKALQLQNIPEYVASTPTDIIKGGDAFKVITDASTGASRVIRPDLVPPPRTGIMGFAKDAVDVAMKPAPLFKDFGIDYEMRPATLAGLGFITKQAGTPLPEPEPLPLMQQRPKRDFSKYAYKGPLQRGEYQYADPESLYRERDASTYGYVGAKEGGVMKFQMGGFSPIDPRMKPVDSRPSAQSVNIMSPPSGRADPSPSANFVGPSPINQPPMSGITQTLKKAGEQQQPGMNPLGSPLQTMQGMTQTLTKDVQPFPPGGSYSGPQIFTPKFLDNFKPMDTDQPRIDNFVNNMKAREITNVIRNLPRNPIDVTFKGLGSVGLAVGGEVPGMEKELPAGITGPSSTVDMSAVNYGKSTPGLRQKFDDQVEDMFSNMLGANRGGMRGAIAKLSAQMLMDQQGDAMFKYAQDNNLLGGLGGIYQGPLQRGSYRYPSSAENLAMGKEDVSKIGYENVTYPGVENMAEGGEVQSDETLQENAFVIPADVVGHIGDGSSGAGAQRLQQFLGMNPQQYQAGGIMAGELQGPGGGMDDLIQTSIEGKQAAAVSPQEFVVPRDIVAELGQGSYDQGSKKLYALMRNVRKFKTGKTEQPAELNRGLNTLMRSAVA